MKILPVYGNFSKYKYTPMSSKTKVDSSQLSACSSFQNSTKKNSFIPCDYFLGQANINFCGKHIPVYVIDIDGNYHKYDNQIQAAEDLGINPCCISSCICGLHQTSGGYKFALASDVEVVQPDGSFAVDESIISSIHNNANNKSIYVIDKDGKYKKYKNIKTAAAELGLNAANIRNCLAGQRKSAGGYTFVKSIDVETRDENGKIIINEDMISQLAEMIPDGSVYAVGKDGVYQKFNSHKEVADALNIHSCNISVCLKDKSKSTGGYHFYSSKEVETVNPDGSVSVNIKK